MLALHSFRVVKEKFQDGGITLLINQVGSVLLLWQSLFMLETAHTRNSVEPRRSE